MELWLIPLFLRLVTAHVAAPALQKILAAKGGREERFPIQFVVAGSLTIVIGLATGAVFNHWLLAAAGLGALSAVGAYCQWRAMDISLSRYAISTWADDLLAMVLGLIFLGEAQFLNARLIVGVLLAGAVVTSLLIRDSRRKQSKDGKPFRLLAFCLWAGGFSLSFGCVIFLIRVLALQGVISTSSFLVGWYPGALCVALLILLGKKVVAGHLERLTLRDVRFSIALGVVIAAALGAHYWVLKLAPLVVTQPILMIAEATLPALIGLFFFNEKQGLTKVDYGLFGLGAVAIGIIAFSFT